jgi:hypothetical protein
VRTAHSQVLLQFFFSLRNKQKGFACGSKNIKIFFSLFFTFLFLLRMKGNKKGAFFLEKFPFRSMVSPSALKVGGNEKNGGSGRSQMLDNGVGPWRSRFIFNLNMQFLCKMSYFRCRL